MLELTLSWKDLALVGMPTFPRFCRSATVLPCFGRGTTVFPRFHLLGTVFPRFGRETTTFPRFRRSATVLPRFGRETNAFKTLNNFGNCNTKFIIALKIHI